MENLFIPAALLLVLTNLSFALLAWHWRKQAKASERAAMGMACDLSRVGRDSWEAGWAAGRKYGIGLMFKAAIKTADRGGDVLDALSKVRHATEEAPIVQVLEEA